MLPFCQETEKRPFSPFSKTWHLGSKITVSANKAAHPALRIPSFQPRKSHPNYHTSSRTPSGAIPSSPQGRAPRVSSRACTRRPPLSLPGPQAHPPASSLTPRPSSGTPHSYSPRPPKGNIVTVTKWRDHTCYFRSSWHLGSTHRPSPSVSHTSPVALRPLPRRQK